MTLYGAESILKIDYRIAVSLAYAASVAAHYLLNRYFTFAHARSAAVPGQLARYAVLVGMNYVINLVVVMACVEWLGWPSAGGVVLSMPITLVAGYMLARHWVFAPASKRRD